MSGLKCDRRTAAEVRPEFYNTVMRPAMMYSLETVALSKRREAEQIRGRCGDFLLRIQNEQTRGTASQGARSYREQFSDGERMLEAKV